jgi:hypothetical protein
MTQNETPPVQLTRLREAIGRHYNLEEFRTLCADLDVKYDDLPARSGCKIRELVSIANAAIALELISTAKQFPKGLGRGQYIHLFVSVPPCRRTRW